MAAAHLSPLGRPAWLPVIEAGLSVPDTRGLGLNRQGEDLVNEKSRHGSQKAPELFRKFKVRHKQASYRRSFSTEMSFLWLSP